MSRKIIIIKLPNVKVLIFITQKQKIEKKEFNVKIITMRICCTFIFSSFLNSAEKMLICLKKPTVNEQLQ